jgi:hypothetical protein
LASLKPLKKKSRIRIWIHNPVYGSNDPNPSSIQDPDPRPSQNATDQEHCYEPKDIEDIDRGNTPTFDRLIIILFMDRRHLSHFGKP